MGAMVYLWLIWTVQFMQIGGWHFDEGGGCEAHEYIDTTRHIMFCPPASGAVHTVDISDPVRPRLISEKICGRGDPCYNEGKLFFSNIIWDIKQADRPKILTTCDLPELFRIRDGYLYGMRRHKGLQIYDISDPRQPTLIGSLAVHLVDIELNKDDDYPYLYGIKITGGVIGDTLVVIDISDPYNPKITGKIDMLHVSGPFDVKGEYLYLVSFEAKDASQKGGFYIYYVGDPYNPQFIGMADYNVGHPFDIVVYDQYAYVQDWVISILIFDISIPYYPIFIGSLDYYDEIEDLYYIGNYCKDGNYIFMYGSVSYCHPIVAVIDVSDPANPYLVSTLRLPSMIRSACYLAPYIYFVADDSVIRVLDTHDELFYRVISEAHIPDSPEAICSDGTLIYTVGDKLLILKDVAIDSFSVLGECNLPLRCKDIVVRSGIAYVIADSLLFIVDVKDSHNPEVIGTQPLAEHARELDVYANHVYITQGDSGVVIVDASVPSAPQEVGWLTGMKKVNGLTIAPPYMFVVSDSGLWQWDITQPDVPGLVQHKPLKYRADEVTVGDQYVFVHYSRDPIGHWRIAALSRDTLGLEGVIGCGYIRDMVAVDDTLYVISGGITGYAIKEVGIAEGHHQTVELLNNVITNGILLKLPDCHGQQVEITLYDLAGRMLRTLYRGYVVDDKLLLDIREVKPGVYFVKIKLQRHSMVNKIIVVK